MKRFAALLAGSALVAALSFAADTPAPTTDQSATTTKKHVKKHRKAKKGAAATTDASAPAKK